MPRLNDAQLLLLSNAAQRDDRAVAVSTEGKPATKRLIGQLIERGLLEETAAKRGMPVWRKDEAERAVALLITEAGLRAIGVAPAELGEVDGGSPAASTSDDAGAGGLHRSAGTDKQTGTASSAVPESPRDGTKLSSVVDLLRREEGASITDLIQATGWLPHTARAALTGLRKRGYAIATDRGGDGKTCYRVDQLHEEAPGPA